MYVSSCRLSVKKENRRARIKADGKSIFRRYAIRRAGRRFTHEKRVEYRHRLKNYINHYIVQQPTGQLNYGPVAGLKISKISYHTFLFGTYELMWGASLPVFYFKYYYV